MRFPKVALLLLAAIFTLSACSQEPKTGPEEVRWDREMCVRCLMAVSDHNFSAQVRGGPAGRKSKVYFYDDIGCAVLWLDEQDWWEGKNWWEDLTTEIWVTDWTDGTWLDARKAFYVKGHITPMDFHLGAQVNNEAGALDFNQAMDYIRAREQKAH